MSAIITYDISSQQAVTATFTELQQQLLAQVAAGSGLTWFMDNRKEMYVFAKRPSNRKFKKEIEAKWLITQTLSALKEKMDELIREFFDNLRTKTACAVAEAAQELRKQQQSEGGQADQSGMDSRKKGEQVAEAEDTMEVDGTGPSGMPKAPAPKGKVPTAPKRRNEEDNEGRKVVRGHGGVQSKPRGPQRSPTVDEEEMKVIKKEEFDALIRPRIETLDEAMRRQMEKGKGKAMDLAASGAGKATDEITVRKIVAPKKRATAKLKSMVGSETDEAGEAGRPVASPSKPRQRPEPSSDEGKEFPEPSDDDEESDSGKRRNPRWQAKPRKGSMALPKVEIVERNMCGTTRLPLLGPTNVETAWPTRKARSNKGASWRIRQGAQHTREHWLANGHNAIPIPPSPPLLQSLQSLPPSTRIASSAAPQHAPTPTRSCAFLHPSAGTTSSIIAVTSPRIPFDTATAFTIPDTFSVIAT
ncbi:hypothetical protein BDN71DRAFT_1509327 [Pleurotus eryngii]|uniref:Uncharacterized protein n=1 Tax=Pleurotus eryngii TaxID=5323 RepID=A0A9P5ZRZ7_PLEER|nr:hypothetical protein BDN71DRAFT_1509327 [Pleurotus eryngii]